MKQGKNDARKQTEAPCTRLTIQLTQSFIQYWNDSTPT